jgi:hypothetical protein
VDALSSNPGYPKLAKDPVSGNRRLYYQADAAEPYPDALLEKLLEIGPGRIAAMDAAGIDVAVLSLTAPGIEQLEPTWATRLAHEANDELAAGIATSIPRGRSPRCSESSSSPRSTMWRSSARTACPTSRGGAKRRSGTSRGRRTMDEGATGGIAQLLVDFASAQCQTQSSWIWRPPKGGLGLLSKGRQAWVACVLVGGRSGVCAGAGDSTRDRRGGAWVQDQPRSPFLSSLSSPSCP